MQAIRSFTLAAACATALCITTGCAGSKYGAQITQVRHYPACYRPIEKLRQTEHSTAKGTAVGALLGGIAGAVGGLLVADSDHRGVGAAVGAVTGAVAGGMAGNIYARKQQISDENQRMASYLQDLEGDIQGLDIVSASARHSLQCYDRQFKNLVGDIKAKRVSRSQAAEMFEEISNGRAEAANILGAAETNGRRLDEAYREALAQEERNLKQPPRSAAAGSRQAGTQRKRTTSRDPKKPTRDGIAKAKSKQRTLNRKVEEIRKEREVAQARNQADSRTVTRMLEEIDA